MSSGPNIPDGQRVRPRLVTTTAREVFDALERHCKATGETRADVIERALRKELGLPMERAGAMAPEDVARLVTEGLSIGPCSVECSASTMGPMQVRVDVKFPTAMRHVEGVARWLTSRVPGYLCVDIVASGGAARVYGDRWAQARVVRGRVVSYFAPQFNGGEEP